MTDYDATIAIGIAIDKLDKLNELAVSIDRIIMAIDSVNERQAVAGKIAAAASDVSEEVGGALSQITRGTADSGAAAAGIVKLASGFAEIRKAATQAIKDTRPIVGASKTLADSIVEGFDLGEARKEVFADMDSFFTAIEKQLGIEKTTLAQIFSLSDILIAGGTGEKEAVATAKAVFDQVVNAAIKAREKYNEKNDAAKLGVGQVEDVTKQIGQKTAPRLLPIDPGVADLQVKGIAQIGDAWGIVIDAQDAVGSGARRLAQLQNDASTRTVLSVHNIVDSLEGVDEAIQQTARTALNASKSEVDFVAALLHPGQIENANKFMQLLEGLLKKKRENIKIEADKVAAEIKEATKTEQIELNKATKQRIKASEEYEKMINLLRTGRLSKNDPSVSESARNRIEREQAEDAEAAMRSRFRAETQYRLDILGLMYKEYQGQELTIANALEIIAAKRAEAELADKVADAQYAQERAQLRNLEVKQKIIQTTAKIERDATGNTIANREVLADIHIKEAQALKRTNEALIQNAALSDASHKANVTRNQQLKTLQENIRIGGIEYGDEEKAAQYIVEQERIAKIEEESIRRARDLASEKQEFEQALMREASLQDQSAQSQEARDYKRLSIENQLLEVKKRNFDLIVQVAEAETRASNLELVKAAEKLKLERAARGEVERTTTAVREKTEALTAEQKAQQRVNQEAQKQEAAEMDRRNILGSLGTRIQFYERQLDAVFRAGFRLKMVGMDLRFVGERMSTTVNELVGSFAEFEFMSSKAAGALGSWATTSEDASENFSTLQEKVLDASIALRLFGATEISQALYFYASTTGQMVRSAEDLDDIFTALTPIMQAAAITGTNYETAIKGVYSVVAQFNPELITLASTMGDYGVISEKIADVTHKLFAVTQATAAEMPDLINSFKMVGSVAGQSGAKFEDVVDLFGRLADLGIRGTMAGRGLRQMFIQMVRPAPAAVSTLTQLFAREEVQAAAPEFAGKSYYEIFFPEGEFLGTKRYIETLAKALDAVDASYKRFVLSRISTANELPILTAMVQQQQMFSKNAALAQSKTMDLNENASKIFAAAWERSANTTKAALGVVQNSFEAIRITIGGAIAEGIEPWLNSIADAAAQVLDFVRSNQVLAANIGKFAAAAGVLLTIAGGLTMVAGSLIGFFAAVKLVFAAFIPVAATIGGAILTIVALVQVFMDRADEISAAWDRLTSNISKNTKDVEISFDDMISYIRNILEPFAEVVDTLIVGPMIALINGLAEITSSVSGVSGTVDVLTGLLKILSYYFGVKLVADIAKFAKSTRVAGFLFGKEMTRTVGEVLDDKGNVITPGTKEKYREQGALSRARETISRSIPKNNMEESFYAYRRLYEGTYAGPLRLQKPPGIDPLTGLPLGPMHGPPKPIPGMGSLDEISKAEKALVGVGAAGRVAFGSIKGLTLAVAGLGKAFLTALGPIGWLVMAFSAFELAVSENFLGLGDIIENFNRSLENSNKKLEESLSALGDYALEFRKIWSSTQKQIVTVGEEQHSKGLTPDEVQRGVGSYGGFFEGLSDFAIGIGGRGSYGRELINNLTGEVRTVFGGSRTKLNENVAAIQAEWLAQVAEDMDTRAKEVGQALGQEVTPEYYSKLATALSENLDMSQPGTYELLLNAVDALVKTLAEGSGTITKEAYKKWKKDSLPGITLNYEEFLALINRDTLSAYTASQEAIRQAKNAEYAPYVKELDLMLASGVDPSILLEKIQEVIPKDRSGLAIEGWGGPRILDSLEQTLNEFLSGEDVSEETRKWFFDVFIPAVTAGDALAGAELASLVGDYVPVAELGVADSLKQISYDIKRARDLSMAPAIDAVASSITNISDILNESDLSSPEVWQSAASEWTNTIETLIRSGENIVGSETASILIELGKLLAEKGYIDEEKVAEFEAYAGQGTKQDIEKVAAALMNGAFNQDFGTLIQEQVAKAQKLAAQNLWNGKLGVLLSEIEEIMIGEIPDYATSGMPIASNMIGGRLSPKIYGSGQEAFDERERLAEFWAQLPSTAIELLKVTDSVFVQEVEKLIGVGVSGSHFERAISRRALLWEKSLQFVSGLWTLQFSQYDKEYNDIEALREKIRLGLIRAADRSKEKASADEARRAAAIRDIAVSALGRFGQGFLSQEELEEGLAEDLKRKMRLKEARKTANRALQAAIKANMLGLDTMGDFGVSDARGGLGTSMVPAGTAVTDRMGIHNIVLNMEHTRLLSMTRGLEMSQLHRDFGDMWTGSGAPQTIEEVVERLREYERQLLIGAIMPTGSNQEIKYFWQHVADSVLSRSDSSSADLEFARLITDAVIGDKFAFNINSIKSIMASGRLITDTNKSFQFILNELAGFIPLGEEMNLEQLWRAGKDLGAILRDEGAAAIAEEFFSTAVDMGQWKAPSDAENPIKVWTRKLINQQVEEYYNTVTSKKEWKKALIEANKQNTINKDLRKFLMNAVKLGDLVKNTPASLTAYTQPVIEKLDALGGIFEYMKGPKRRQKLNILRQTYKKQNEIIQAVYRQELGEMVRNNQITQEEYDRILGIKPTKPPKGEKPPVNLSAWLLDDQTGKKKNPIVNVIVDVLSGATDNELVDTAAYNLGENIAEQLDRGIRDFFTEKPITPSVVVPGATPTNISAWLIDTINGGGKDEKPEEDSGLSSTHSQKTRRFGSAVRPSVVSDNTFNRKDTPRSIMLEIAKTWGLKGKDTPRSIMLEIAKTWRAKGKDTPRQIMLEIAKTWQARGNDTPRKIMQEIAKTWELLNRSNTPSGMGSGRRRYRLPAGWDALDEILYSSNEDDYVMDWSQIDKNWKAPADFITSWLLDNVAKPKKPNQMGEGRRRYRLPKGWDALDEILYSSNENDYVMDWSQIDKDWSAPGGFITSWLIDQMTRRVPLGMGSGRRRYRGLKGGKFGTGPYIKYGTFPDFETIISAFTGEPVDRSGRQRYGTGPYTALGTYPNFDTIMASFTNSYPDRSGIGKGKDKDKPESTKNVMKMVVMPVVSVGMMMVKSISIDKIKGSGAKPASSSYEPNIESWLLDNMRPYVEGTRNPYGPWNIKSSPYPNFETIMASFTNSYPDRSGIRGASYGPWNIGYSPYPDFDTVMASFTNKYPDRSGMLEALTRGTANKSIMSWLMGETGSGKGKDKKTSSKMQGVMKKVLAAFMVQRILNIVTEMQPGGALAGYGIDPLSPEGIMMSGVLQAIYNNDKNPKPTADKKDKRDWMSPQLKKILWMRKYGIAKMSPPSSYLGPAEDQAGGLQGGLVRTATQTTPSMFKRGPMFKQMLEEARETAKKIPQIISRIVAEYKHWGTYGYNIGKSWGEGWSRGARDGVNNALITIRASTVGNSPPKLGPLKDINRGGRNIGMAWGDAFGGAANESIVKGAAEVKRNLEEQNREFAHRGNMDVTMNRNDKKQIQISLNVTGDGSANRATMSELRKGLMDALVMADLEHMVEVI